MEEIEEWKIIPTLPQYEASITGKIRNAKTKKEMNYYKDKNGYVRFRWYLVHRCVALAHIPLVEGKDEVNHKDDNKANNYASNLEWTTRGENIKHTYKTGLIKVTDKKREINRNTMKKLNEWRKTEEYRQKYAGNPHIVFPSVYQFTLDGKFVNKYLTRGEAYRAIGQKSTGIYKCCKHIISQSAGYVWREESEVVFENGTYRIRD